MIDQTLKQLVEYLMKVAPEVWLAASKQINTVIWLHVIWVVILLVVITAGIALWQKGYIASKEDYGSTWEPIVAAGIGITSISTISLIVVGTELFMYLNNPYWYTIQKVLELVTR
jgi:hypothetical protein